MLYCFRSFSRFGNLSFALFWQHLLLRTWPFLTVCAVCQSTVFSLILFFAKLCIAWSRLVLAVSSVIVATWTVFWYLLLKGRHVVLILHHSLIHQPLSNLLLKSLPLASEYPYYLKALSWFSHLFSSFLYSFCLLLLLSFLPLPHLLVFLPFVSRTRNGVWADCTDLLNSFVIAMFSARLTINWIIKPACLLCSAQTCNCHSPSANLSLVTTLAFIDRLLSDF